MFPQTGNVFKLLFFFLRTVQKHKTLNLQLKKLRKTTNPMQQVNFVLVNPSSTFNQLTDEPFNTYTERQHILYTQTQLKKHTY